MVSSPGNWLGFRLYNVRIVSKRIIWLSCSFLRDILDCFTVIKVLVKNLNREGREDANAELKHWKDWDRQEHFLEEYQTHYCFNPHEWYLCWLCEMRWCRKSRLILPQKITTFEEWGNKSNSDRYLCISIQNGISKTSDI